MRLSKQDIIKATDSLSFSFTNTKRGENISMPSGTVIDLNGVLWGNASGNITIIGGNDNHVYAKIEKPSSGFYMNEDQKSTMNSLIYLLAMKNPHNGEIKQGNSLELYNIALAAFENYRS